MHLASRKAAKEKTHFLHSSCGGKPDITKVTGQRFYFSLFSSIILSVSTVFP